MSNSRMSGIWNRALSGVAEPFAAFIIAALPLLAAVYFNPPENLAELDVDYSDFAIANAPALDEPKSALEAEEEIATPPADIPPPWLEYRIRRGDTMEKILKNIGAEQAALDYLTPLKLKSYRRLRRGDYLQFRLDSQNRLSEMRYKTSPKFYLYAGKDADGNWRAEELPPKSKTMTRRSGGRIESSLFAAADKAGFSDSAMQNLIEALETQIDFYRDSRRGDSFRAIYEETLDEDGTPLGESKLLAFEYISLRSPKKPRLIRGARHQDGGYYKENGESLQGAFLRAPLKFGRISSRFTKRRFHPILKRWRSHRGVDYAAPTGTPVRAAADGAIYKVARERGYGRIVMIKHFNIYTTVYAHLSRFAKGVRRGRRVQQGQIIGYVGQTGLATGPHLHYEFRVRGKHINPLSAKVPKVKPPLKSGALSAFQNKSRPLLAELSDIIIP